VEERTDCIYDGAAVKKSQINKPGRKTNSPRYAIPARISPQRVLTEKICTIAQQPLQIIANSIDHMNAAAELNAQTIIRDLDRTNSLASTIEAVSRVDEVSGEKS
jgi:hypothetical protein